LQPTSKTYDIIRARRRLRPISMDIDIYELRALTRPEVQRMSGLSPYVHDALVVYAGGGVSIEQIRKGAR
jgi:hypothetical protein